MNPAFGMQGGGALGGGALGGGAMGGAMQQGYGQQQAYPGYGQQQQQYPRIPTIPPRWVGRRLLSPPWALLMREGEV
jgi:hypothetical protein